MARNQTFPLQIGWNTLLKDLGMRPEKVLRHANLPLDLLSRPATSLTTEAYFSFWRALEAEAGDALFPLRIVDAITAEVFDPPLFAALCSSHLMHAVQRLAKYKQLIAPMRLEVQVQRDGDLRVSPRWLLAQGNVPPTLEVAELAFFVKLARLGTREQVKAVDLILPTLPSASQARSYQAFFGVSARQGPHASLTLSASDSLRPFLTANDSMWRVFEPDLRRRLSALDATASTAERVRAVLLELLPANAANIDTVAERLALSKRTLQRRLEQEGENFRALVNLTRENLARHYLANTAMPAGEIAFLLGFEDPNSFYRAFQDWTGQTPDSARHATRLN